jgi:hypothetical protein
MSGINVSDIDRALYLQAKTFQASKQYDPSVDQGGWGQFLNINPARTQIGTYGTASGTIITNNGLSEAAVLDDVRKFVVEIWGTEAENNQYAGRRFSQNLKLFLLFLAATSLTDTASSNLAEELSEAIAKRRLSDGLWGDWWIDDKDHDSVSRIFPSSIAIICQCLSERVDQNDLTESTERLAKLIAYSSDIPVPFLTTALAAICLVEARTADVDTYGLTKDLVWSDVGDVQKEALYIYEYKYLHPDGSKEWRTEIFTFPETILLAIAALQFKDETVFNIFCYNTASRLVNRVIDHDGLLPSDAEMRTHCMPQMWCSIFLSYYRGQLSKPSLVQKIVFNAFSPQSRSTFWYKVFPLVLMPTLAVLNVTIPEAQTAWRVVVSITTVLVAGVWGPDVIRRWLPGGR